MVMVRCAQRESGHRPPGEHGASGQESDAENDDYEKATLMFMKYSRHLVANLTTQKADSTPQVASKNMLTNSPATEIITLSERFIQRRKYFPNGPVTNHARKTSWATSIPT